MTVGARLFSVLTTLTVFALLSVGLTAPAQATSPSVVGTSVSQVKKATACARLKPKQRDILRRALAGKRLTQARCLRYGPIVRAAQQRARLAALARAKKQPQPPVATQPPTVFGLSANGETALREAERTLGFKAGVVGVFTDFTRPFPTLDAQHAATRGASLLISWEPWNWDVKSQTQPEYSLDRITAGDHDEYIRQFARDAAAYGRPVFVRFAAEMNGDWHVWSTGYNGNGPGDYQAAYRHVVDVARAAGGTNIKWMFNPIVSYEGSTPLAQLYPGDAYVDWVALDGYNWGPMKWGWQSFTDIFAMGLAEIKAVAPNKPLGIAEIGCYPGSQEAAWVSDALTKARANGVRMIVWFEHNKETDWRLSSTTKVASATKSIVTSSGWLTGGNYQSVSTALGL